MIKSAILQMYFGERGNCEQIPQSMKYRNLLDDFLEQVNIESAQNHFSEGFRFGLLMGLDVAQTDNG